MKNIFFGLGIQFDEGKHSHIAVTKSGLIIEVHKSQYRDKLWYRLGNVIETTIKWAQKNVSYDSGVHPNLAINNRGNIVEVHESEWNSGLWYRIGTYDEQNIYLNSSKKFDVGYKPSISMNDYNIIVETHEKNTRGNTVVFKMGILNNDEIEWSFSEVKENGKNPSISINNQNNFIIVTENDGFLNYQVGKTTNNLPLISNIRKTEFQINWGNLEKSSEKGKEPSITLTDDGFVILVYQINNKLMQKFGYIKDMSIFWHENAVYFDDGKNPCVANNGNFAIQVHESEKFNTLWFSSSKIFDRANWMKDNYSKIGNIPLKNLTLPASHDAAMYLGGLSFSTFGKTQFLNIYEQLKYGIRYFDLRPGVENGVLSIYHGPILGPLLKEVLDDIKKFMEENHNELVILKFSHYKDFNIESYKQLVECINSNIGKWLFDYDDQDKQRLSEYPLAKFTDNNSMGRIIVVCDGHFPVEFKLKGILVYRDWDSDRVNEGDFIVFDEYSNTMSYDKMWEDQINKYMKFEGHCKSDSNLDCDFFLLSWTLTPPTAVWSLSKNANRNLAHEMSFLTMPNRSKKFINFLYADYVEFSRVVDVALEMSLRGK